MPLTRYQIRNEYSLADPELYRAADKDDPEALLEGVAMAGLVGVLRQLGDLSEFAAEIFHNLHEEVMTTAARSHGLMIRVQQLEAEFPSIEKAFLSQTSHSLLHYNAGIDWHPNLRMDQNLISQGDLPRFVMDSYEECRGPPRLFLLDKFDIAGAGACLKRYSDPSFFKVALKEEVQKEKKVRRIKKKGIRGKNGETPEGFPLSHAKLHQLFSEERFQIENNVPTNRVKLKKRQLNGYALDSTNGKSYMERFVEIESPDREIFENSAGPYLKMKSTDSIEWGSEIHEISSLSAENKLLQYERSPVSSPHKQETILEISVDKLDEDVNEAGISEKFLESMPGIGLKKIPSTFCEVGDEKESIVDEERKIEACADGYPSDDIASETDNYLDALTTMESELETDTESRHKNGHGFFKIERHGMDSDRNEEQIQVRLSNSNSFGNSSASDDGNNSFKKGSSVDTDSDIPSNLVNGVSDNGDETGKVYPFSETCVVETVDSSPEKCSINRVDIGTKSSDLLVPKSEIPSDESDFREASCNSCNTDSSPTFPHLSPDRSQNGVQLVEPVSIEITSGSIITNAVGSSANTKEDGRNLGNDLSCMTSFSDYSSEGRDNSSHKGSSESLSVEEWDGRVGEPDALLHTSEISYLALEREGDFNLEGTLPVLFEKLDSPHSLTSHTEEQSYGMAEQEQETCSGTTSVPECLPIFITSSNLDDVKTNDIVTKMDENIPSTRENTDNLILAASESGEFAEQDLSEVKEDAKDICDSEAKDGFTSNMVRLSSLDAIDKGEASPDLSSELTSSDSAKPVSEIEVHLQSDDLETRTVLAEVSSPKYILESDVEKEVDQSAGSPTYLNSVLCNQGPSSELLDSSQMHLHLSNGTGVPMSSEKSLEELETNSPHQIFSERAEDDTLFLSHYFPELSFPSELASELQDDQLNVESSQDCRGSLELSNSQSERKLSSENLDRDGHMREPFSTVEATRDSVSPEPASNPLISTFPSFNLHPEANFQQELEQHPSSLIRDLPLADPNVLETKLEEVPPLPPLPPMQWRIGKLRQFSLISEGEMIHSSFIPFSPILPETADMKAPQSFLKSDYPPNPFLPESSIEDKKPQNGSEIPILPETADMKAPQSFLKSDYPPNPFLPESGIEDKKPQNGSEMLGGEMVQGLSLEGMTRQPLNTFPPLPGMETEKSQHGSYTFASLPNIQDVPGNASPFLNGESVQPVNIIAPDPNIEDGKPNNTSVNASPPPLVPEDENIELGWTTFMGETAWPSNGNSQKKYPRPRDPLIEAVASHDKSTMRKVTERARSLNEPKVDERDSLLEQIRAKSFNLKPALTTRPSIQGPKTNLKVAAILEKANAIRQALAGSDEEEDDDDSWSDS